MTSTENKILLTLLSGLIVLSVYFSYQRTKVKKDFETFDSEAQVVENALQTEEPVEESAMEMATGTDSQTP
ncbi:MAG: hypothetical protein KBD16_00080 [Candidatus Pacebacteria bacterium]|nr:hypothetical protein [Candidatus Paceibacterota bacterium]